VAEISHQRSPRASPEPNGEFAIPPTRVTRARPGLRLFAGSSPNAPVAESEAGTTACRNSRSAYAEPVGVDATAASLDAPRPARATSRCRLCDRPTGAGRSAKAVVPSPAGRRLDLGDSASDELPGAIEIRTPAFPRSASAKVMMIGEWRRSEGPRGGVRRVLPRESPRVASSSREDGCMGSA
jgi:hypothetical protein